MKFRNSDWLVFLFSGLVSLTTAAQTCNSSATKTKLDAQYLISQDGSEVTDVKTGLIWQRCSYGMTWSNDACSGSASALTIEDALLLSPAVWRLPNVKELFSLVETSCSGPSINQTIFPNAYANDYWTSSMGLNQVYIVNFNSGVVENTNSNIGRYVRLVRSQ